jgi:hypothetical protein
MTNLTDPPDPTGDPNWAASFYRWEVAGKPIAILLNLDLMDRLEREATESFKTVSRRGSEIGGVLGGRVIAGSRSTVIIERFEPVECDYSRGPLYALSGADKERVKQALERTAGTGGGMSVVGFFRSNTRRDLVLDEEDQVVAKEFFSDPNHVFLLVRPFAMKPCLGGFFFWENGQLANESYQPFPFKRAELGKKAMAAPAAPISQKGQKAEMNIPITRMGDDLGNPMMPIAMMGDDLGNLMMQMQTLCRKCGKAIAFEEGSQLAMRNGIRDTVVMCPACNSLYQVNVTSHGIALLAEVTEQYAHLLRTPRKKWWQF